MGQFKEIRWYFDNKKIRKNSKTNNKEFRLLMPPMVSIIPMVEEVASKSRMSNFETQHDSGLILQRNKPLPNARSTLIETIGIRPKAKKFN